MTEEKKEKPNAIKKFMQHHLFEEIIALIVIIIAVAGIITWHQLDSRIYIEKATITAPIISISTLEPGVLHRIYVVPGDTVGNHKAVALVGDETIYTDTGGRVISVLDVPGQIVTSQDKIVQMIDPKDLRLVGQVDEDKGFSDIKIGQKVVFTVDAYGSKKYEGVVSDIALSARQSDIVFSISDKREIRQFDITVKFDAARNPELLNGMSAKMWIYK